MTERQVGQKAERTRQAILDAAIAAYGEDGYAATSVAAIARRAGVSRPLAYAYFNDGEGLFLAALDQDAAGLIQYGLEPLAASPEPGDLSWRHEILGAMLAALDKHPLARRVLAGLEPHATNTMLAIPAIEELRERVGLRLAAGQDINVIRKDIDPALIGRGVVNLWIGILMSVVQFGTDGLDVELPSIRAVLGAAVLDPQANLPLD